MLASGTALRRAMRNRLSPRRTDTEPAAARSAVAAPTRGDCTPGAAPRCGTRMVTCICRWPRLDCKSSSRSTADVASGCDDVMLMFRAAWRCTSRMVTCMVSSGTGGCSPARRQASASATLTCSEAASSGVRPSKGITTCKGAPGADTTRECPTVAACVMGTTDAPSAKATAQFRALRRQVWETRREREVMVWNPAERIVLPAYAGRKCNGWTLIHKSHPALA